MPVFVELTTDAFENNFRQQRGRQGGAKTGRAGTSRARRPMRGLEVKEDTYAFIKVVGADGHEFDLFDGGSETGRTKQYTNFILQSVQEARMEKHQIVETFGEAYIFFFGESPRFLDVQAMLINSHDFNWEAEFWANYNEYLRGTKLVEMGARTYLFYDDTVVEGYWMQAQAVKMSDQPLTVQLSFRLYLTNYSSISLVGDANFPVRASVNLPPNIDLRTADAFTVVRAAVDAAGAGASTEVLALMAAQGAAQQAGGFGGGQKLSDALRGGLAAYSDISGVLNDAARALYSNVREAPLRGPTAQNYDEFTQLLPASPAPDEADEDGEMTMVDSLPAAAAEQIEPYGARVDNPDILQRLGLGPSFIYGGGYRSGNLGGATFGPVAPAWGMGFSGQALTVSPLGGLGGFAGPPGLDRFGQGFTEDPRVFGVPPSVSMSGVQMQGGVMGGVGIGGGVAGGLYRNLGGQMTGATSFRQGQSTAPCGGGVGASNAVGGVPTAFSMVAVEGTFNPFAPEGTSMGTGSWMSASNDGVTSGTFVS